MWVGQKLLKSNILTFFQCPGGQFQLNEICYGIQVIKQLNALQRRLIRLPPLPFALTLLVAMDHVMVHLT